MARWLKDSACARLIVKGQYVVYERASRNEESLFLDIAGEVVEEIEEPADWKKPKDPRKRGGGRPYEFEFRPMLLVLMLMVRDRKDYREMESHLRNNPNLVNAIGAQEGSIQIVDPFGRIEDRPRHAGRGQSRDRGEVQKNLGRPRKKHVAIDSSGLGIRRKSSWYSIRTHAGAVEEERLPEAASRVRMPRPRTSRSTPGLSPQVTGTTHPDSGCS